jgi:hypothetical protein
MTAIAQETPILTLAVDPLRACMKGKAFARYSENKDGIADRFKPEHILARAKDLGRDLNCLDLQEMHFEDPAFGTPNFPQGVSCRKCAAPVERAMVSLVVLENGNLLEKRGERVERGHVRVILSGNHYIPAFFCGNCRFTETVQGSYRKPDGTQGTYEVHLPKTSFPTSFRQASAKAKHLNFMRKK